ncbi:multidrug effflux MFS transporter [Sinorhizobium meliloti]|uniref:multidrug effflux MFS transporter n=1 Tax=Rhizobium meliloti TaxID=382 RepID=UPI003F1426BA
MTSTPAIDTATAPRANLFRLTVILASLTAFAPFATDMYLASFPMLAESFHTDLGVVQIGLSVFFLGLAVGPLFYGPSIDRFGRKLPLLIGVGLFVLASLLIVVAPSIEIFIAFRLLQAFGGAAGMIISCAVIADLFSEQEAARVLSLMMLVQGLAPVVAPVLGGYIVATAGWQAVFLFLGAFGLVCFAATALALPETLPVSRRQGGGIGELLHAWTDLMTRRAFIIPTLAGGFAFAGLFAFISGSPFVYMELFGVSKQSYGWLFGLNAIGLIAAAQLNRSLLRRFSSRLVLTVAVHSMAAVSLVLVLLTKTASLPLLVTLLWICLAHLPLIGANATALSMSASEAHRGSGSAIIGALQFAIAGLVSAGVSLSHNGTAYPMVVAIFACSIVAVLIWRFDRIAPR